MEHQAGIMTRFEAHESISTQRADEHQARLAALELAVFGAAAPGAIGLMDQGPGEPLPGVAAALQRLEALINQAIEPKCTGPRSARVHTKKVRR